MKKLLIIILFYSCNCFSQSQRILFHSSNSPVMCGGGNNIAYDASSTDEYNGGSTSNSFNHTCTGSNLILIVGTQVATGESVSGITYNGVAMTLINSQATGFSSFNNTYLYYLVAPATGTHSVTITSTGSSFRYSSAASYTGVDQTNPVDVKTTTTASSATSITGTLTTACANEWLIAFQTFQGNANVVGSGGTGVTIRQQNTNFSTFSDKVASSAGSNSLVINSDVSINMAMNIVALKSN